MLQHPVEAVGLLLDGKGLARILLHAAPALPQTARLVDDGQRDDAVGPSLEDDGLL